MAKAPSLKILTYAVFLFLAVLAAGIAAWYAMMYQTFITKEGFTDAASTTATAGSEKKEDVKEGLISLSKNIENECPTSAERGEDGRIHVQPQGMRFDSMADYVAWLGSLSTAGSMCVMPYVRGPREVEVVKSGTSPSATDRLIGPLTQQIQQQNTSQNVYTKQVDGEQPYAKTPIDKLDDYEYTRVFDNERSPRNNLSRTTVNSLMAKNQFDWSKLPFNSEHRAGKEDEFIADRMEDGFRDPKTGIFFKNVEGMDVNPPDVDSMESQEKGALEPFKSQKPQKLLEHDTAEVAVMIKKMYANDPDFEPVVEKIGESQYRIAELRPKPKKEKYSDAQDMTVERARETGLIDAAVEVEGGSVDPYFDKNGIVDYSNDRFWEYKDFKKWTPGLERMFAPTLDTTNWL